MSWKNILAIPAIVPVAAIVGMMVPATPCGAQVAMSVDPPALAAMKMEMKRSMEQLRLKDAEKPYFIQYTVRDHNAWDAKATFGTLMDARAAQWRTLDADVRVGSPESDNTGFLSLNDVFYDEGTGGDIVAGDDVDAIRHEIWLATDRTYKRAVEQLAKKQAFLSNKVDGEKVADFSNPSPAPHRSGYVQHPGTPKLYPSDTAGLIAMIRRGSAIFRSYPGIQESRVQVHVERAMTYVVTSDNMVTSQSQRRAAIEVFASAQGDDGMRVHRYLPFHLIAGDDKPLTWQADLDASINAMARELTALVAAPVLEKNYDGPVLFTGQAAAELMLQMMAPHFSGHRPPVADQAVAASIAGVSSSELAEKINRRVLPRFLSVYDDPMRAEVDGHPLIGRYAVDDQGIPAEKVTLVENGVLKNLLMTRRPTQQQHSSNGHARLLGPHNVAASVSNLFVESSEGRGEKELKEELIKLCRDLELPYGIMVRAVQVPGTVPRDELNLMIIGSGDGAPGGARSDLSAPVMAYKVYVEDGREELVRGLAIGEFSLRSLRYIAAAGNTPSVYNRMVACQGIFCRDDVPVSVVAPSLLFEELEMDRTAGSQRRPALLTHPYFGDF